MVFLEINNYLRIYGHNSRLISTAVLNFSHYFSSQFKTDSLGLFQLVWQRLKLFDIF